MNITNLEDKLTEIYEETHKDIIKYVVSKCSSANDVNDIVQNVYLNFYKRLKRKGDIDNPKKYLVTIARNEVIKQYGILKLTKSFIPVFSKDDGEDFSEIEKEISKDDINYEYVLCEEVWAYIKTLDILTFKIFVLYYNNDLKIIDISKILKINESTVKSRLYRGIKKIRDKFNK